MFFKKKKFFVFIDNTKITKRISLMKKYVESTSFGSLIFFHFKNNKKIIDINLCLALKSNQHVWLCLIFFF